MSNRQTRKPILVSGSHRSGSTWLGRMIDLSDEIGYIHEPFNPTSGITGELFNKWFIYICEENEGPYKKAIGDYLNYQYPFTRKIREAKTWRDYARPFRDFSKFSWYRLNEKRPLMKDPISIFSAEWLHETFNMDMIILIRHPAAFVGSIKKVEWRSGMGNYLKQPLLMRDYLKPFEPELKRQAEEKQDYIEEAVLLWNMIHSVILKYQATHDDWFFIRHEDLSKDPIEKFEEIYNYVNLDYTPKIRQKIKEFSTENESASKLKRNSESNVWSWKRRLTPEEIKRVREGTKEIASHFYSEEDW
ncbi:sulfotransferase [Rhodohalobacter sp. 614A]|uniref:sulfotransferase n=1 Tax=Rhodohalobacter sp. 614A TaxID=2908649 RepID=UPI001F3962A6|nr:sulfotransferase [Rhodohalobacter sp. 614A]